MTNVESPGDCVKTPPKVNPVFDVPVEAEVLPSLNVPVNGEDVLFVVALASEKLPGVTGVVVGAGLLNVNNDPPKMEK